MINIIVPLAGKETFTTSDSNIFPRLLSEINGKLLIERAAEPFFKIQDDINIIVIATKEAIDTYQLDSVFQLLDDRVKLISINNETQGSVASALLAIEELIGGEPLIISSFEQVLEIDLNECVNQIKLEQPDAAVLVFDSLHPRWSYSLIENGRVVEVAEKKQISKNAIAGFYYFKNTELFISSAMKVIKKDVKYKGSFYVSATLNEIILNRGVVLPIYISHRNYFYIKDDDGLQHFTQSVLDDKFKYESLLNQLTQKYISYFNNKDLSEISNLLSADCEFKDPFFYKCGKVNCIRYIDDIFKDNPIIQFKHKNIFVSNKNSIIEFELILNKNKFFGVDILSWNKNLQIESLTAYLHENKTNEN